MIDNEILENVQVARDLGVLVDNKLTFTPHITDLVHRASTRSILLRNTFKHMDKAFHIKLFKIFVLPVIEYCSQVAAPTRAQDSLLLENVQRAFTRCRVFYPDFTRRPAYPSRLTELGLHSLYDRRKALDLQLFIKLINDKFYTTGIDVQFSRRTRTHDRQVWKPSARGGRENFWYNRTINTFNDLPASLISCTNLNRLLFCLSLAADTNVV